MAKFYKEYEIHLGDRVEFRLPCALPNDSHHTKSEFGRVCDISELPDIVVETGTAGTDSYKRYRISVNLINEVFCKDEPWISHYTKYEGGEPLEYVYSDDLKEIKIIKYYE